MALVGPSLEKSFRLPCLAIGANKRIFVTADATWGLFFDVEGDKAFRERPFHCIVSKLNKIKKNVDAAPS